jgi:hypothetical protein
MANKELAAKTYRTAVRLQLNFATVHSPMGLVARPIFKHFSLATVEHLLDCVPQSPSEIAILLSTPEAWICNGIKANSAGESLRRASAARGAKTIAEYFPNLVGSRKQVLWAQKIRINHATKTPSSPHLTMHTAAAWWIENRNAL